MKLKLVYMLIVIACVLSSGCTEQRRAKVFGGTITKDLAPNTKLIAVDWKEENLWVVTRPMTTNDIAATYEFSELSSAGLIQGKVILREHRSTR